MLLSLFLFGMVFAIAFLQATQGLFTALIMTVITLCCAAFAMYGYEWVAVHWLIGWKPNYAFGIALGSTFGLSLLVVRVVFDKAVPRAPLVPQMVDRLGGAACGLVTGFTIVGMLAVSLGQIPFGGTVLGFERIEKHVKKRPVDGGPELKAVPVDQALNELLLTPDRFAMKMAGMTSRGVFSGSRKFGSMEPDLVEHISWVNSVFTRISQYAEAGSIDVLKTFPVDYIYDFKRGITHFRSADEAATYDQIKPKDGHEFWAVRLKLGLGARGTDRATYFTFSLRQIRMVGEDAGRLFQFFPLALQAEDSAFANRHTASTMSYSRRYHVVDDLFRPLSGSEQEIEVVFELPIGFESRFVEYKRGAVVEVRLDDDVALGRASPSADTQRASAPSAPVQPASTGTTDSPTRRGGRVRGFTTKMQRSYFGDELPLVLSNYAEGANTEIRRGVISEGSVAASTAVQDENAVSVLKKFKVPDDKRLLHLSVGSLQARSLFGRALGSAVAVAQNYTVDGDNGQIYKIIGKYARAQLDNADDMFELQYYPNAVGTIGGLRKFSRIQKRHLDDDADVVFLFLIDPGVKIEYFSTGGRTSRRDDLRGDDLVAPK